MLAPRPQRLARADVGSHVLKGMVTDHTVAINMTMNIIGNANHSLQFHDLTGIRRQYSSIRNASNV